MRKRIYAALMGLAMVAGLVVAAAAPASAGTVSTETVYWNCPAGVGCIWSNSGGGGTRQIISLANTGHNLCHNLPNGGVANDAASSASGDFGGTTYMVLYRDAWCVNEIGLNARSYHGHSESFTGLLSYFNDIVTSYAIFLS